MKRGCLYWTSVLLSASICLLLTAIGVVAVAPVEWFLPGANGVGAAPLEAAPPVEISVDAQAPAPETYVPPDGDALDQDMPDEEPADEPPAAPDNAAPAPTVSAAQVNFVSDILKPMIAEAERRRAAASQADPAGYARRVDRALSAGRLNFLVTGYGATYEIPYPPTYKGHLTLYSLDLKTLQIASITLNHDIRAPEVERFSARQGRKAPPTRIDRAYLSGSYDLARTTVEDATGLNVDFQLVFQDSVVQHIVDEVFGGLIVDVPWIFDSQPIVYGDKKYPALRYAKGRQKLNGLQTLQFIKGINATFGKSMDPGKAANVRKQIVVRAILEATKQESTNPVFWARMLAFLRRTLDNKEIEYDFDAASLIFQVVNRYVAQGARGEKIPLAITRSLFVVDKSVGDGGVQWVSGSKNPIMVRDLRNGVYPDKALAVPTGSADPYAADLAAKYWTSVRQLVKRRIAP